MENGRNGVQIKYKNMALISDVSWMTWMTLRIMTILLETQKDHSTETMNATQLEYKDKHIRTGNNVYVNII